MARNTQDGLKYFKKIPIVHSNLFNVTLQNITTSIILKSKCIVQNFSYIPPSQYHTLYSSKYDCTRAKWSTQLPFAINVAQKMPSFALFLLHSILSLYITLHFYAFNVKNGRHFPYKSMFWMILLVREEASRQVGGVYFRSNKVCYVCALVKED